jgi:hypothetical protein
MIKPFCNFIASPVPAYPTVPGPNDHRKTPPNMYRYLFSTAVAILIFFSIARARDSTRTADLHTSDKVMLGIGFGQDYGHIGGNLTPVTLSIGYKFILI